MKEGKVIFNRDKYTGKDASLDDYIAKLKREKESHVEHISGKDIKSITEKIKELAVKNNQEGYDDTVVAIHGNYAMKAGPAGKEVPTATGTVTLEKLFDGDPGIHGNQKEAVFVYRLTA